MFDGRIVPVSPPPPHQIEWHITVYWLYTFLHMQVLGSADVTLADRSRLPYVEAVIMETLRYCSLGGLTFKATTRDTSFKGYSLPAGTEVINIHCYSIHAAPINGMHDV